MLPKLQTLRTSKAPKRHITQFLQLLHKAFQTEIKKSFLTLLASPLGAMTELDIERVLNHKIKKQSEKVMQPSKKHLTRIRAISAQDVETIRLSTEKKVEDK